MIRTALIASLAASLTSGCETTPASTSAVLRDGSPQTMQIVKATLSEATGRAQVRLGPGNLMETSVVSVLPPGPTTLEGNSTALPEIFELIRTQNGCALERKRDGEVFALKGVKCRAK